MPGSLFSHSLSPDTRRPADSPDHGARRVHFSPPPVPAPSKSRHSPKRSNIGRGPDSSISSDRDPGSGSGSESPPSALPTSARLVGGSSMTELRPRTTPSVQERLPKSRVVIGDGRSANQRGMRMMGLKSQLVPLAPARTVRPQSPMVHATPPCPSPTPSEDEVAPYSEVYYATQKAKWQLFKLQILTERIMHERVKKLLRNAQNPEEEIESLCKLLATVGMDVYFSGVKELVKSSSVTSRVQFMFQDVIELGERKWVSRNAVAAPTTLAQVHEAAAHEKATYQCQMSMSRGSSRRGGDRGGEFLQPGPDGLAVAGGPPKSPPKAGDLSSFGQINKTTPMTFGPSGVFAGKKGIKRETPSRTSSSSDMSEASPDASSSMSNKSNHTACKASVDISQAPQDPPMQRKQLVLQPRTVPVVETTAPVAAPASSDSRSGDEALVEPIMSTEVAASG